jgi:hypothetical protein
MKDLTAMCTVVISLAPEDRVPLLLLGVRDELTGRPWRPPARHWPGSPLIGGLDEQAGGTWLAVHPDVPRVGCILNGRGHPAPPERRRTRGELPLRVAAEGPSALRNLPHALADYDPFHLVCADQRAVSLLSWDGSQAELTELPPGTHVLTNAGHAYPPAGPPPDEKPDEKAAWFGPKFAAHRPSGDPDPGTATIKDAWADWLTLAAGDDLASTDPAAIIVRHELPDGRIYGSTSVSLVALARDGRVRYDFQADPKIPPDPTTWYSVDTRAR